MTLAWRIRNADAVQIQAFGQAVTVGAEGNMRVAPPQNTTYQIVASGPGGSISSALTVVVRPARQQQQAAPSPTHTLAEETTAASPANTPTIRVESPDAALSITLPPATLTSTPTSNATHTLAPLSATSEVAASAIFTQQEAQTPVTPLLMFVGLAVLVGLPLLGVAAFLLVWLLHRPK